MSLPPTPEDSSTPAKRTAFSELMASKPKKPRLTTNSHSNPNPRHLTNHNYKGRDNLLAYIQNPTSFPPGVVIRHNDSFVTIRDLYPKASIHLLLLPRSPAKHLLHPIDALSTDATFLASVRAEAAQVKTLAATELRRLFGPSSATDQPYLSALDSSTTSLDPPSPPPPPPPPPLPNHSSPPLTSSTSTTTTPTPPGRDWTLSLRTGIHAHPSMTHLHIHIISTDLHSPTLRHRKHYNSFATPFFVPLDDFPLAADDVRRHPGREGYLQRDFACWRCGKAFGNHFARLKAHLEEEFEAWKRE